MVICLCTVGTHYSSNLKRDDQLKIKYVPKTLQHIMSLSTTCRIFLGFEFLVRNEKKNGIPHEKWEKTEKNPAL